MHHHRKQVILYTVIVLIMAAVVALLAYKTLFPKDSDKKQPREVTEIKIPEKTARKNRLAERRNRFAEKRRQRMDKTLPSDTGMVEVDAVSDQIRRVDMPQDKIALMNQLWQIDDPAIPQLVTELLNDRNAEVRMAALELLDNKEKGEILACIERALDDPDKEIREYAVILLSEADPSEKTRMLLGKSAEDPSEDVRSAAFDVIGDQDTATQEQIFSQSILSPHQDVKEMTVDLILDIPSHRTVNLLFQGLNDNDKDFREYVQSKLDFLFGKEFANYNEALAWWNENKDKYDEELFEK